MIIYLGSKSGEFWVVFIVKLIERAHVLAVADEPVDRREMFALGELFVKTPEHLNNSKSGRGYRVREITTRRRYSTNK